MPPRTPQKPRSPRKTKDDAKKQRKRLEKELDSLWGKIIHASAKNCQWPGCINTDHLAAHHFFTKAHGNNARWNLNNGVILCFSCHIRKVHQRGDVEPVRDVMIRKLGQEGFDQLKNDVRQAWKPTIDELEVLKEDFAARLSTQLEKPAFDDLDRVLEECGI